MTTGEAQEAEAKDEAPRMGPECGIKSFGDACVLPLDHEQHVTASGWAWFANRPKEANEAINRLEAEVAKLRAEKLALQARVEPLELRLACATNVKDAAFSERNQVLSLLARMALSLGWRAGVGQHPAEDATWKDDWRTILFVDLPTGQASWHFHDSERHLLAGLPDYPAPWDGHTTDAKYERVRTALAP